MVAAGGVVPTSGPVSGGTRVRVNVTHYSPTIGALPDEAIETSMVRFRTLGCYPLTGAVESTANDLTQIVLELLQSRTSEREGRAIDSDSGSSMEKKKQEGYF